MLDDKFYVSFATGKLLPQENLRRNSTAGFALRGVDAPIILAEPRLSRMKRCRSEWKSAPPQLYIDHIASASIGIEDVAPGPSLAESESFGDRSVRIKRKCDETTAWETANSRTAHT
jgi:hypothetical protein